MKKVFSVLALVTLATVALTGCNRCCGQPNNCCYPTSCDYSCNPCPAPCDYNPCCNPCAPAPQPCNPCCY